MNQIQPTAFGIPMVLACAYCGQAYQPGTPKSVLTDHIQRCEVHPLHGVLVDRDRLREAVRLAAARLSEHARIFLEQRSEEGDARAWPAGELSGLLSELAQGSTWRISGQPPLFEARVGQWLETCFGHKIAFDTIERNHRFLEEALELVQACGCKASEAHQLVDYVFARPRGEKAQEVGGVLVTLAALCYAQVIDMADAGATELERINDPRVMEKIRAKQATKPKHSPLPESAPAVAESCAHCHGTGLVNHVDDDGAVVLGSDCPACETLGAGKPQRFFAWDPVTGDFETFAGAGEAAACAEKHLDWARDEAPEGWPEETDGICYGKILGEVVLSERRAVTDEDRSNLGIEAYIDELVNYELVEVGGPKP